MAPPEPPSEVTVRVKVPPGHLPGTNDEVFLLGALSTAQPVGQLRQRIQTLVPTNPPPTSQRILYGGRALIDDEQTLAEAFNTRRDPTQTDYVIHLLIRNGGVDSAARGDHVPSGHVGQMPVHGETANVPDLRTILGFQASPSPGPYAGNAARHFDPQLDTTPGSEPPFGNVPGAVPHRHHHHHHHRPQPQPHFHHGPHVHHHAQHAPFPRDPSSHGFHMTGVGPDGEHFAIQQHTFTTTAPNVHPPPIGPDLLHGIPGLPMGFFPGMPQAMPPQGQPPVFSALERARDNMTEMRRMLETMREGNTASEETRARVADIEQRMQAVNDYIDPFHLGGRNPSRGQQAQRQDSATHHDLFAPQPPQRPIPPSLFSPLPPRQAAAVSLFNGGRRPRQQAEGQPDLTTVYLLSSPQGPHALLFHPQHGSFAGFMEAQHTITGPLSMLPLAPATMAPTPTQPAQPNAAAPLAAQGEQPGMGLPVQAQAGPLGMLQPVLGPLWFLVRLLIFAYFLMGAEMGWRRPLALLLIGLGFWLIRLGLFGNGGLVRRWWDGVVRVEDVRDRLRRPGINNAGAAQGLAPADANLAGGDAAARPFPTPEQLAERLIRERQQQAPLQRLREQIRPAERALALFIASLWPGVGERYVQALDRAREEEEAARRLIQRQQEEAAQAQEAAEQADNKDAAVAADQGNAENTEAAQQAESSAQEKNDG